MSAVLNSSHALTGKKKWKKRGWFYLCPLLEKPQNIEQRISNVEV